MLSQQEYCSYYLCCPLCEGTQFTIIRDDEAEDGTPVSEVHERCPSCNGEWVTIYHWDAGFSGGRGGFMVHGFRVLS